ncbi:hypothetical protein JTB14_000891 [Gonioctena quinquepunctata]|nr:hypothetical protein JTB14_000891 [Gonioctena quinquepunctata]
MENDIAQELELLEVLKNANDEDIYVDIMQKLITYAEQLKEVYNAIVLMRMECIAGKLHYSKTVEMLNMNNIPEKITEHSTPSSETLNNEESSA